MWQYQRVTPETMNNYLTQLNWLKGRLKGRLKLRFGTKPMALRPVSHMSKTEVMHELIEKQITGWGAESTAVEVKAILSAVRKLEKPINEMKGLTTMKKAALQQRYREVGLGEPGSLTRGLMIAEIRQAVQGTVPPEMEAPKDEEEWTETTQESSSSKININEVAHRVKERKASTGTKPEATEVPKNSKKKETTMNFDTEELTTVRFGKHRGTKYHDMMETNPSYCNWVIETYEIEDEADAALKHFAVYLKMQGFGGRNPTTQKVPPTDT